MGVNIIDVILCVQRNDTTLSHMFLLPRREHDYGGGLLESGGLQVDTRPTYNTRETKDMYVWGEYIYGDRY